MGHKGIRSEDPLISYALDQASFGTGNASVQVEAKCMSVRAMGEGVPGGAGIGGIGTGNASAFGVKKDEAGVPFAGVFALAGGGGDRLPGLGNTVQAAKNQVATSQAGKGVSKGVPFPEAGAVADDDMSSAVSPKGSDEISLTGTQFKVPGDAADTSLEIGVTGNDGQDPAGPVRAAAPAPVLPGLIAMTAGPAAAPQAGLLARANGGSTIPHAPVGVKDASTSVVLAGLPAEPKPAPADAISVPVQTRPADAATARSTAAKSVPTLSAAIKAQPVESVTGNDGVPLLDELPSVQAGQSSRESAESVSGQNAVAAGSSQRYGGVLDVAEVQPSVSVAPNGGAAPPTAAGTASTGKSQVAGSRVGTTPAVSSTSQGGKGELKDGKQVPSANLGTAVSPLAVSLAVAGEANGMLPSVGIAVAAVAAQPVVPVSAPASQDVPARVAGVSGGASLGAVVSSGVSVGAAVSGGTRLAGSAIAGLGASSGENDGAVRLNRQGVVAGVMVPEGGKIEPTAEAGLTEGELNGAATGAPASEGNVGGEVVVAQFAATGAQGQEGMSEESVMGSRRGGPVWAGAIGGDRGRVDRTLAAQGAPKSSLNPSAHVAEGPLPASTVAASGLTQSAGNHAGQTHGGGPVFQAVIGGGRDGGVEAVATVTAPGAGVASTSLVTPVVAAHPGAAAAPTASGAAASSAGASTLGEMTGTGSGLMGGAGVGPEKTFAVGHTTLEASPTVLEVGVPGGANGWVKIRAELGEGGSVQASMTAATEAGREALHRDLPGLSTFLQSEHVPVSVQVTHAAQAGGTMADAGGSFGGASTGGAFGAGMEMGAGGGSGSGQTQSDAAGFLAAQQRGSEQRGEQQRDSGSGGGIAQGAAIAERVDVDASWAGAGSYGGAAARGGSWLNVMA